MGKPSYRELRERAERIRWLRWRRAYALCRAAGCSDAGHLHNALVSRDYGKPWREVDYSKARAAHRLYESQFVALNWLSELVRRRGVHAFNWEA